MAQYHLNNVEEMTLRKGRARAAVLGISFRDLVIEAIERAGNPESVVDAWYEATPGGGVTQADAIRYALTAGAEAP